MAVTVQDIIGFAKNQNIPLARGGTARVHYTEYRYACARRILANEVTSDSMYDEETIQDVWEKFGLTQEDQSALEDGFEGSVGDTTNLYYQIGQETYRLSRENK